MKVDDYNGLPRFRGTQDEVIVGDTGFTVHRLRTNRRTSRNWEYVSGLEVEPATFHKNVTLRITSNRLSSVLVVAFDTEEEANEVKEFMDGARADNHDG